jgi:hypothetical protein
MQALAECLFCISQCSQAINLGGVLRELTLGVDVCCAGLAAISQGGEGHTMHVEHVCCAQRASSNLKQQLVSLQKYAAQRRSSTALPNAV